MEVLITGIVGLVTTIISGWTTYFFTRKKYNTEVASNQIHNMDDTLAFYIKSNDDMKARLDYYIESNKRLEEEVRELRKQVNNLTLMYCSDLTCMLRKKDLVKNA